MTYLLKELQCLICLTNYDLDEHKPYCLACSHIICQEGIDNLYNSLTKTIQCPKCKKHSEYESKDSIPQNFPVKQLFGKIYQKETHPSIYIIKQNLKILNSVIETVQKENKLISEYVQELVERKVQAKQHNDQIISQINAYKCLIESNLKNILFIGIKESEYKKVEKDISSFNKSYLKLKDFKANQDLKIGQLKDQLRTVQNRELITDYSTLKANVLNDIDNGRKNGGSFQWVTKNLPQILNILKKLSKTDADDAVVLSFLYWLGIGVQQNDELAKKILQKEFTNSDGRALNWKYQLTKQPKLLTRSCLLGYGNSFFVASKVIKELPEEQVEVILHSASAHLNSTYGMRNLAHHLYIGDGIEKNEKDAVKYYLKALQNGLLTVHAKKTVDNYYKENEEFRKQHPHYKPWNGDYDEVDKQVIQLL